MPKRVIDGDSLWVSEKLTRVPEKYRAEYAWLLPLAQANGCFECTPMKVWRDCYSALRADWEIADVAAMLEAFEAAKMLFRWTDKAGKTFGFFIGSQKEGRLPKPSDRVKSAKQWQGGMLPVKELAKFLGLNMKEVTAEYGDLLATSSRPGREKSPDTSPTGNGIGNGIGGGSGAGAGNGSGEGSGIRNGYGVGEQDGGGADNTATLNLAPLHPITSSPSLHNTGNTQHTPRSRFCDGDEPDELEEDDELDETRKPDQVYDNLTELGFAKLFRHILRANPNATEPPKGWADMWLTDFKALLRKVGAPLLLDIIAVSQLEKNQQYYVRPKTLVDKYDLLFQMVKERKKAMPVIRSEFKKAVKKLEQEGHRW